ncbi:uncharacterized protein K02A2.6-like [Dermacentor silvarum]|uniref:uncharacterized protein K02A2.6-like n=1 Tax=Dermacentor silvarum TaxID=543639 RepID=UPI0021011D8E|nr:uncharacterized protein K02A2.6-like [Dermacentor silvarum]
MAFSGRRFVGELLSAAGDEALEVYNNFTFAEGELKDDYETLLRKFDAYCIEQGYEVYERHVFRMRLQDEGEHFERFARDLRTQAKLCNFGTLEESLIRDQIVFGTNNKTVREKMLRDKTLTLQIAENMCKAAEAAAQQNAAWATERMQVDCSRRYERGKEQKGRCKHCCRVHAPWQCPAYGKTCYACKKKNHFSSCCKNPQVHGIQEDHEDSSDVLDVSICGISTKPGKDWIVRGRVSGHEIELKVDTVSQANLIPLSIFQCISKVNALRQSAAVLTAYNGSEIKHLGVATKAVEMNGTTRDTAFFIVKKGCQAIIGLSTCIEFGIVPANIDSVKRSGEAGIETEFAHLFRGTGCVQRKYKMVLRPDAVPVAQPARKVPLALKQPLRDELARMEKASIIVKVEEPTEWIPLDEATSRVCTFATPFGRYRFLRLPFGISSASEVFQKTLTDIFESIPGVRVYVDDVLIWGTDKTQHDQALQSPAALRRMAALTASVLGWSVEVAVRNRSNLCLKSSQFLLTLPVNCSGQGSFKASIACILPRGCEHF